MPRSALGCMVIQKITSHHRQPLQNPPNQRLLQRPNPFNAFFSALIHSTPLSTPVQPTSSSAPFSTPAQPMSSSMPLSTLVQPMPPSSSSNPAPAAHRIYRQRVARIRRCLEHLRKTRALCLILGNANNDDRHTFGCPNYSRYSDEIYNLKWRLDHPVGPCWGCGINKWVSFIDILSVSIILHSL